MELSKELEAAGNLPSICKLLKLMSSKKIHFKFQNGLCALLIVLNTVLLDAEHVTVNFCKAHRNLSKKRKLADSQFGE